MVSPNPLAGIPSVRLDRRRAVPLFRQIYHRIREAILDGTLPPGSTLPSSRGLAAQLSTARGTVELAYALLVSEGYAVGRGAVGTVVNPELSTRLLRRGSESDVRARPQRSDPARVQPMRPFQMGLPALDAFPRKLWARLHARRARSLAAAAMVAQDPDGYAPLRQAIAGYLAISRGIRCSARHVFITAGYQGALGLITRTVLTPGDPVLFENPGYFRAREALALAGAAIVPAPVDSDGLDFDLAIRRAPDARLAVVTPSHQCPLGVMLSLPRRLQLLEWAVRRRAWIVEDDYDSEFRYRDRPIAALKSLDEAGRVLYAGSFSKVLSPGLRLGYLVVPPSELDRFSRVAKLLAPSSSLLDQMVVADFVVEGHFARHLKRMRRLYAERRDALATALRATFGDKLTLEVPPGGMHLIGRLSHRRNIAVLTERAQRAGLNLLASCIMGRSADFALLLSFTNIPVEAARLEAQRLHNLLLS